jgi:hypothetical protein
MERQYLIVPHSQLLESMGLPLNTLIQLYRQGGTVASECEAEIRQFAANDIGALITVMTELPSSSSLSVWAIELLFARKSLIALAAIVKGKSVHRVRAALEYAKLCSAAPEFFWLFPEVPELEEQLLARAEEVGASHQDLCHIASVTKNVCRRLVPRLAKSEDLNEEWVLFLLRHHRPIVEDLPPQPLIHRFKTTTLTLLVEFSPLNKPQALTELNRREDDIDAQVAVCCNAQLDRQATAAADRLHQAALSTEQLKTLVKNAQAKRDDFASRLLRESSSAEELLFLVGNSPICREAAADNLWRLLDRKWVDRVHERRGVESFVGRLTESAIIVWFRGAVSLCDYSSSQGIFRSYQVAEYLNNNPSRLAEFLPSVESLGASVVFRFVTALRRNGLAAGNVDFLLAELRTWIPRLDAKALCSFYVLDEPSRDVIWSRLLEVGLDEFRVLELLEVNGMNRPELFQYALLKFPESLDILFKVLAKAPDERSKGAALALLKAKKLSLTNSKRLARLEQKHPLK